MMEYNLHDLKIKIEHYFDGHSTKQELGTWGHEAYYDLLTGGYIQQKKLVLYPFLKTISQFHLEVDDIQDIFPSSEADIRQIQMVLQGKKDTSFSVTLSIPPQFQIPSNHEVFKLFCKAQAPLTKCIDTSVFDMELQKYIKQIVQMPISNHTVLDIIQGQIVSFCHALFTTDDFGWKPPLKLYAHAAAHEGLIKLKQMIECYTGNRHFIVIVSFQNGLHNLELFI